MEMALRVQVSESNSPISDCYCETTACRKTALLSYFDEKIDQCGNCDNCLSPQATEDLTDEAKLTLQVVIDTGQYFELAT